MKVLVLGAGGMIGSAMFRILSVSPSLEVVGTLRSSADAGYFDPEIRSSLLPDVNVAVPDVLVRTFADVRPDVVVNCVGLTKHVSGGNEASAAIAMNALLPHRIASLCAISDSRLIHISTDCVFLGDRGAYTETDVPDAPDIYGRSKQLGEVIDGRSLTLRTSTIGHEYRTRHGLLEWFLSQTACKGYTRALFSGVPSVIFAGIVRDMVLPNPELTGLFHVAGPRIAKADLLRLVADAYERDIRISPDESLVIDRSLDAGKFATATGYRSPSWPVMVRFMHDDFMKGYHHHV